MQNVVLTFITPGVSNKLSYVLNFIESVYNVNFEIVINEQQYFSITNDIHILKLVNSGLLFQNKIPPPPNTGNPLNLPKPYFFASENVDIKEDYLSGIFFMLSRSEEYYTKKKDNWGRYLPEHYWASQNFALKEPIVDYWLSQLISKINNALFDSPQIQLKTQYQHIHTIDVDNAYFYLGKGKVKNGWRLTKNLFNLNFAQFYLQLQVMVKNKKDPYDTYSYHKDFCESLGIKPIYFIQPGNYGFPDTNISLENPYFIKLIKHIKTFAEIGLHPSYKSNFDFKLLKAEKNALENVIDDEVIRSRQHYLVSDMPNTYLNLSKLGIIEDYSMGYAHDWGFRSGTTHPYYFFDLKKNQKTKLKIYPLGLMDGTLKDYLKLNTSKAEVVSQEVISKYRTYNGTFVSLWHNHTISDSLEWKNWKSVFENQMYAASNQITRSVISTEIHND